VGIAGSQTGVYTTETPGGWRLIGHTPVRLYDPARERPFLLRPGDRVRFRPVDEGRYREVAAQVAAGEYVVEERRIEEGA
jgi:allophanate hydrolase subunit 1